MHNEQIYRIKFDIKQQIVKKFY